MIDRELSNNVRDYVKFLKEDLQEMFNLSEVEALKYIHESKFKKLIDKFPEQVLHYETDYWAEVIYCENKQN